VSDEEREYLNEMIRSLNNRLVDALRERDKAQREVARLLDVETGHRIAIANLTAERDEARWQVCELSGNGSIDSATREAEQRGWGCYKDEPKS
jgi:hypothetical protein